MPPCGADRGSSSAAPRPPPRAVVPLPARLPVRRPPCQSEVLGHALVEARLGVVDALVKAALHANEDVRVVGQPRLRAERIEHQLGQLQAAGIRLLARRGIERPQAVAQGVPAQLLHLGEARPGEEQRAEHRRGRRQVGGRLPEGTHLRHVEHALPLLALMLLAHRHNVVVMPAGRLVLVAEPFEHAAHDAHHPVRLGGAAVVGDAARSAFTSAKVIALIGVSPNAGSTCLRRWREISPVLVSLRSPFRRT